MLTVIEGLGENRQAQTNFARIFQTKASRSDNLFIGWQGGSRQVQIYWSDELKIWWSFRDNQDGVNKYWRAFGTNEPHWTGSYSHTIQSEINSPFKGMSRRVAAGFVKDEEGRIFLVHRGNIGGGKKGVGKLLFFEHTHSRPCIVRDSAGDTDAVLVGELYSPRFCWQVAEFVHDIERIKKLTSVPRISSIGNQYYREYSGKKEYEVSQNIVADCDHGLVVDTMRRELESKGYHVANDRSRDLYILNNEKTEIKILFEFKTDSTPQNVYSAIGQLLFNSPVKQKPKLIAVFPDSISRQTLNRMIELNIQCITYEWRKNRPYFRLLSQILK